MFDSASFRGCEKDRGILLEIRFICKYQVQVWHSRTAWFCKLVWVVQLAANIVQCTAKTFFSRLKSMEGCAAYWTQITSTNAIMTPLTICLNTSTVQVFRYFRKTFLIALDYTLGLRTAWKALIFLYLYKLLKFHSCKLQIESYRKWKPVHFQPAKIIWNFIQITQLKSPDLLQVFEESADWTVFMTLQWFRVAQISFQATSLCKGDD